MVLSLRDRDVAPFADAKRVPQRVLVPGEYTGHLFRGFQEELIPGVAQPLRVVNGLARADAEQDVVRLIVALPQVMDVVRGDEWKIELARERDDPLINDLLFLDAL